MSTKKDALMENTNIERVRDASRVMVRELGLLGSLYGGIFPTNTQCHIMVEIAKRDELQPQDLAQILRIDKSTLSRVLAIMRRNKWISILPVKGSKQGKTLTLTAKGEDQLAAVNEYVNERVNLALESLEKPERDLAVHGLELYSEALRRSRLKKVGEFRAISRRDDREVAEIIRSVLPEFGAGRAGFAFTDPEVDCMSKAYSKPGTAYFVLDAEGLVLGGGGLAPLKGGDGKTCELQKMYFRPCLRGLGFGKSLLTLLLDKAKELGYQRAYLETLHRMKAANHLYESFGFKKLAQPLGSTGHGGCDKWMVKELGG
jgi:putative acetyltransferase